MVNTSCHSRISVMKRLRNYFLVLYVPFQLMPGQSSTGTEINNYNTFGNCGWDYFFPIVPLDTWLNHRCLSNWQCSHLRAHTPLNTFKTFSHLCRFHFHRLNYVYIYRCYVLLCWTVYLFSTCSRKHSHFSQRIQMLIWQKYGTSKSHVSSFMFFRNY